MNRNRKGSRQRPQPLRTWSHKQALAAVPYLASVMRSLREHQMDAQRHNLTARRLAGLPGRPTRENLIAQQDALRSARAAEERAQEAERELVAIDISCIAPIQGIALLPFRHHDRPAWFVYNLFDEEPLRFWRYHSDPIDTRRPVEDLDADNWQDD